MRRLLLVTLLATLLPAAPAAAHGVEGAITHADTREELAFVDVAATAATAAAPDALPYEWCGVARTTDDTAHAALPANSPRFKLVYAHPADRPDRFDGWRNAIQGSVALIQRFLASQTGGAKAARIDMGTSCGHRFVDIQVVHLSGPRSRYVDNFSEIVREVEPRLGTAGGPRNVVILADTLNGIGYDYGLGENVLGAAGDRRGAGNVHNYGGFASVLFSRDGQPAPGAGARSWWPEGFLHEMSHNLGAVQWSAPHSTQPPGFSLDALRALLAGLRRHVLRGGLRRRARHEVRLPARRRRDPAGLRLRPRRLLQPRAAGRQLPRPALERLRQRVPRAVRPDRPRLRRRQRRPRPDAPGQHRGPGRRRLTAARRADRRARRRLAQRPAELRLPLAARGARPLAHDRACHQGDLRPDPHRPRPPAACADRRHQPGRQRVGGLGAQRAGGRPQGRPRADLHQQAVPR